MSLTTRFLDREALARRVPGCPLAGGAPSACAGCAYNLVAPRTAAIGCARSTPLAVLERAQAALFRRSPALHGELLSLLAGATRLAGGPKDAHARAWLALALAWDDAGAAGDPDEAEVSRTVARFARAALELGEPVEVLA